MQILQIIVFLMWESRSGQEKEQEAAQMLYHSESMSKLLLFGCASRLSPSKLLSMNSVRMWMLSPENGKPLTPGTGLGSQFLLLLMLKCLNCLWVVPWKVWSKLVPEGYRQICLWHTEHYKIVKSTQLIKCYFDCIAKTFIHSCLCHFFSAIFHSAANRDHQNFCSFGFLW